MTAKTYEILIIDDAKSIRMIVHAILADLDSEFAYAEDGQQGFEMIKDKQYDLIITDINMPRMSGLELCEKVRNELQFKNLPMLVMTNAHDYNTVETVFSAGATDFITKPINEVELTSRVKRVLEQRSTEKSLYIAQKAAERANGQKSQFLAMVSHELKTPLNAISGFSHLLLRNSLNEKEQQMLQILVNASGQMKAMIDQLLEYDQIETHNRRVKIESVNVSVLLQQHLDLHQPLIQQKALDIKQNVSTAVTINTDQAMLSTLIANLISNAVKYNKPAGQIAINTNQTDKGLQLSVDDTGIGMTAEQVNTVFEPFSRFERDIEGHGLGMAITKSIIDVLNIDVNISSEKGQGTSISLCFAA